MLGISSRKEIACDSGYSQCLFYGRKWPLRKCLVYCATFLALMAGFEVGMIYAIGVSVGCLVGGSSTEWLPAFA